jgi:hypothetical protein
MAKRKRMGINVDLDVDPELKAALDAYLATDKELKAPAVLRKALREYLRATGHYKPKCS